jgi:hypothetical protein
MSGIGEAIAVTAATIGSTASSAAATIGAATSAVAPYAGIASALASAGLTVMGSQQQAATARLQAGQQASQAAQADFAARQEVLRGQAQANQVRQALLQTLAAQNARYSAAGLALEGTPETVANETIAQAERELGMATTNATIRSEQSRMQASLLRDSADWTRQGASFTETAGAIGAGVNLFDRVDRITSRRSGTTRIG